MDDHVKDIGTKTAGGIMTWVVTYFGTLTIQDLQAYSVIFASVATGIYYLIASYKAWKHKREDQNHGKKP